MKKVIDIIQVVFAYALIYSILKTLLFFVPFKLVVILFIIVSVFVKVTPHPTSHWNPFAFDSRWRFQD